MNNKLPFIDGFAALTSFPPLPWQTALYEKFVSGDFPSACDLPTGLGKTSVIPIWLLALASKPQHVPRRLVYIVNRRTVVDQATTEAVELTKRLKSPGDSTALAELIARLKSLCGDAHDVPLAVSTLRGQFADNGEWAADPSRPAVLCGTVDMIGSRLLFSGYRCGFKRRPLHAGFLGQDALLVHDEAHLESPFQTLLTSIGREQERRGGALKPFRVLELSATPRTSGSVFKLTPEDNEHPVVRQRLDSVKQLRLHAIDDEKKTPDELAERALRHAESGDAVLVFAQSVETVDKVVERLKKDKRIGSERVAALTGTMRGLERDQLIDKDVFQRFLPPSDATNRAPQEGEKPAEKQTVYLVCTSAGEVGVNMSADHLVCDLTTYESMAQRFGRVNRFGKRNDSTIDVLHPSELPSEADLQKEMEKSEEKRDKYVVLNGHRRRTLDLLRELNGSASPASLAKLSSDTKINAFSPPRKVLPTSSILFDAWAMTTIHERFPGRPPIEEYLHGQSEYEPPRTSVAWREEVEALAGVPGYESSKALQELLDDYPLKPHELLSDRTDRVFKQLQRLAARLGEGADATPAWVIDEDETLSTTTLGEIVAKDKENLEGATLILSPKAGGLGSDGLLNGGEEPRGVEDVADELFDAGESLDDPRPRRLRVWSAEKVVAADHPDAPKIAKMRLVRTIDVAPDQNEADSEPSEGGAPPPRYWLWFERPASGDADGSKSSQTERPITWDHHTSDVEAHAKRLAAQLGLPSELGEAIELAARYHDLGKKRRLWQRSIGNLQPEPLLAKAGKGMKPSELNSYRHDFGSLLDLQKEAEFQRRAPEVQELILHLVAVHHGRARPHFSADEAFDPEYAQAEANRISVETPLRFARLQRRYGRWGLAYLESLLRAADAAASAHPSPEKAQ